MFDRIVGMVKDLHRPSSPSQENSPDGLFRGTLVGNQSGIPDGYIVRYAKAEQVPVATEIPEGTKIDFGNGIVVLNKDGTTQVREVSNLDVRIEGKGSSKVRIKTSSSRS